METLSSIFNFFKKEVTSFLRNVFAVLQNFKGTISANASALLALLKRIFLQNTEQGPAAHSRGWKILASFFIFLLSFKGFSQEAVHNATKSTVITNDDKERDAIVLAKTIWVKYSELKEIEVSDKAHSVDFESRIQPFMEKFKQGCPSYPAPSFMIMDSKVLLSWVREHREEAVLLEGLLNQILIK